MEMEVAVWPNEETSGTRALHSKQKNHTSNAYETQGRWRKGTGKKNPRVRQCLKTQLRSSDQTTFHPSLLQTHTKKD